MPFNDVLFKICDYQDSGLFPKENTKMEQKIEIYIFGDFLVFFFI